ncbi:hypothetical protein SGRIM128S_05027 [Streptomyces griseomycini]
MALPDGERYFMKSHFVDELSDEAITALVDWYSRRPTPESLIVVRTLGGAVAHVGPDDSAFAHGPRATTSASTRAGRILRWTRPRSVGRARPGTR